MRVITGLHRPGPGMGMKLPFQHYKNEDDEENKNNSSEEEEEHVNRGTEDEESSDDEERRHIASGKRLNLVSSTTPSGTSAGYDSEESSSENSVDSTEVQDITKQHDNLPPHTSQQTQPDTSQQSFVPDLDTLNADGPTVISSGEDSVTDLTDCGDFLLPDLDSIIGTDDDHDALQGRQQNKNKDTKDPQILERREKNRQAASECRKRQKEKISELEQEVRKEKEEGEKLQKKIDIAQAEFLKMRVLLKHATTCEIYKKEQQMRQQRRFLEQKNAAARVKHAEIKRQKAASSCYNTARVAPRVSSHPYKLVQDQQRKKVYAQL